MTVRMAVAAAVHHSAYKPNAATYVDAYTQTMTFSNAATSAATASLFTVIEHVVPAPAVTHAAPAPVIEYVSSAPGIEHIAPAPAVTLSVPSQQLPPAYTTTTDTTDDNFDTTDLVHPQFSFSCC